MERRNFLKGLAAVGGALHSIPRGMTQSQRETPRVPVPPGAEAPHLVYDWKGAPFEIGRQHGSALRVEIVREAETALAALAQKLAMPSDRALARVVSIYEPLFRKHTPTALEEIRGIAEGSGLSYAHAFFAATRDGMRFPVGDGGNCTAIACGRPVTAGGKILIGQNKDTSAPLARYRITRLAYDSGRRAIVLNYPGWIANLCLTSDGLSFTGNNLYAQPTHETVIPFSLLKRLIMEKRSVREVLEAVPDLPFENFCMLLGDSTGHLVCWENVNGRRNVRDISSEAFGHANSILCAEFKRFELPKLGSACSPIRQANVQRRLDDIRGPIAVEDVEQILADHADYPQSICRHRVGSAEATTASFVANLSDREMSIAIGNPCTAPYRRYTMDF